MVPPYNRSLRRGIQHTEYRAGDLRSVQHSLSGFPDAFIPSPTGRGRLASAIRAQCTQAPCYGVGIRTQIPFCMVARSAESPVDTQGASRFSVSPAFSQRSLGVGILLVESRG